MNRPTDYTLQCPSCHMQSLGPVCGAAKRRINKNEKDEYFKAIDCTLWTERKIVADATGVRKCPTCGQVITEVPTSEKLLKQVKEVFPGSTVVAVDVVSDPFADVVRVIEPRLGIYPPEHSDMLDWGISVVGQQGILEMQVKLNTETRGITDSLFPGIPPETEVITKPHKRRAADIPKAKYSPSRRKKMEAAQ